jgi:hypothetical protein
MKSIKMLGLVALAALMAMAFVGITSAMATSTALCKEDVLVCPEAKRISHVHEVNLTGKPGILLGSVEVLCETVLFLGDVQSANNLGNPLVILGNFTYEKCMTSGGTSCEVKEVSKPEVPIHTVLDVLKEAHELASVTSLLGEVNVHCGFAINCTYDGQGLTGHALGPLLSEATNGEVRIEEATVHRSGGTFCPETGKLDLLTVPLEPVYISE